MWMGWGTNAMFRFLHLVAICLAMEVQQCAVSAKPFDGVARQLVEGSLSAMPATSNAVTRLHCKTVTLDQAFDQ